MQCGIGEEHEWKHVRSGRCLLDQSITAGNPGIFIHEAAVSSKNCACAECWRWNVSGFTIRVQGIFWSLNIFLWTFFLEVHRKTVIYRRKRYIVDGISFFFNYPSENLAERKSFMVSFPLNHQRAYEQLAWRYFPLFELRWIIRVRKSRPFISHSIVYRI